jgi:hypothetical protein
MQKRKLFLYLTVVVIFSAIILSSCSPVKDIIGEYRLTAYSDTEGEYAFVDFEYGNLYLDKTKSEMRYTLKYKTVLMAGVEIGTGEVVETGDWRYEKKAVKFYEDKNSNPNNHVEWDKKSGVLKLTRYSGNRIRVYTFKKI